PTSTPVSAAAILKSLAKPPSPSNTAPSPENGLTAATGLSSPMAPLRVVRRAVPPPDYVGFGAGLHPVLQRVYAARGIRDMTDLNVSLGRLHPVGTLEGIHAAVDLLLEHRIGGRVLIVGDFDADGATSTAVMMRALKAWGFESVDFLVPNRFEF